MEMQSSVSWVLAATGALLLLAGVTGGGFELKDIKIPRISNLSRVLCLLSGAVLIVLVTLPISEPQPTRSSPGGASVSVTTGDDAEAANPTEAPDPSPIEVPPLDGLTVEGARDRLEQIGLSVGAVSNRQVWAPDGRVVEQSPPNGETAARGSTVDIVVADSETSYRAKMLFNGKDGDEVSATVNYRIKLSQSDDREQQIGQFMMVNADISGAGPEFSQTIDRLRQQPGYVSMDAVDNMDLEAAWSAFSELAEEFGHEIALESIEESPSFASMGQPLLLVMAGGEFLLEIKAMLMLVPANSERAESGFDLQAGDELLSTIRITGPPSVSDAGATHRFNITRRAADAEGFRGVGSATYTAREGLLTRLNLMYTLAGESGVYRLEIERR